MTSLSNSSQSTCPTGRVLGKNYSSFLDFTRNYERMSGIFVPCRYPLNPLNATITDHRQSNGTSRKRQQNTYCTDCTGLDKKKISSVKMLIFSYLSVLTYVFGAQKNRLIETVLLSTHNICFGREIRKLNFCYTLLTKVLDL